MLVALALAAFSSAAQTLTLSNGVTTLPALTNTTVTLTGNCELRITAATAPIPGCLIQLDSPDAYLIFANLKPSVVVSTYLSQVRVNGATAVADANCRVVQYSMGTVIVPHAPGLQPLQVFSGPHFTGASVSLGQYVYYKNNLGALYAQISSFKLKRGYMATFAQNESGNGLSQCYIAQDGDLEISVLPAGLDNNVRFVYVLPWRWASKKGIAGNIENGLNLQWKYNWNIDQNSTRDLEYVPIRQQRWWPGLGQNWQTLGANQLLGYNEPDRPDQANIAVSDAIWSWPDLLGTGLRVGAPAVSDGGRDSWLYPFMQQADAAGLRVDFVPVHYYWCFNPADPAGAANQMYNFLKATYDQVKRPLWITEWNNGANWTGCGDPTSAQQQAAIAAMLNMLDTTPFVERYALYNWVEDVRRVQWDDGSLTAAGVTYRDKISPLAYLQSLPDNGTRSFAQLPFETNPLDASGFGNNGVASGCPVYTNGHNGQALSFDGTNTVVTLPSNIARSNAFTFAAWVNWSGGANWQRLFDFGNSTTHYLFLTPSSGSGTLRFAIKNGGSEQIVETAALPANQWRHVAVTLSGNTARLYVNGVLQAQNTGFSITPATFNPRVNFLGKSQFPADPMFKGLLDEVLITDSALSAAQIASLQTNTPPQFTNSSFALSAATEGVAYSNSLAGAAIDADTGDVLTYSKMGGPAWLNLAVNGTLTGTPTSANGGTNEFTVRVTDPTGQSAFAVVTVNVIVVSASGAWLADADANWSETNRWSGNIVASGPGQTADFSSINPTANRLVTLDTSRSIGTLKFSDTAGAQTWTITNSNDSILTLNSGSATSPLLFVTNIATLAVPLAGTNGFTKSGPGTIILNGNNSLSGTVNMDTGNTSFSDGAVRIVNPSALDNAALIQFRNNTGASATSTLQLNGSAGTITINAPLNVNSRVSSVATLQNLSGTNVFNGNILLTYGGTLFTIQSDSGLMVFNGTNLPIGSATGARTYAFAGGGHHLVNGPILNSTNGAPIGLTKSGPGSLTLNGNGTYTNTTAINGGTLLVNGALTASPVTLVNGTTLGGNGSINRPITLPAGASLAPGAGGIGKLTINNSITLQPNSNTRIELNRAANTNDQLRVVGTLTYGGNLIVTNLDGILAAGDSFAVFSANTYIGTFNTTNLPALTPGLGWQFTPANGTLTVVTTVATNPIAFTMNVVGQTLELSWPADHTGWRLQVQTNALTAGLNSIWFDVPGSTATNFISIPIDPGNETVFYRMIYP